MKTNTSASALFASLLLACAPLAIAAPPTITLTTPAQNQGAYLVIAGTATDTAESGTSGEKVSMLGIKEVRYQVEGSKKWKRAQLTAKNSSPSGWFIEFDNTSRVGKRITFYAVDRAGLGSPVISTRFKRVVSTATVTPTPTTTVTDQ